MQKVAVGVNKSKYRSGKGKCEALTELKAKEKYET